MGSRSRYPKQFQNLPQDKYGRQKPPIEVLTENMSKIYTLLLEAAGRIDKLEEKVFPKPKVQEKVEKLEVKKPKIKKIKNELQHKGHKQTDA